MVSPHYTPTGNPRDNIPSSSERFRQEYLGIEAGLQVMTRVPVTLKLPDVNSILARNRDLVAVVPFAGIFTDVSAVLHAANATATTDIVTYITNAAGTEQVNHFFLRIALDADIGEAYFNPSNTVVGPVEVRTVEPGDIIFTSVPGSQGSSVMPITITYWLTRT